MAPPLPTPASPVRKWPLFLNLSVCRQWKGVGLGGGGGGAKSYDGEEAWYSINPSILPGAFFSVYGGGEVKRGGGGDSFY